MMYSLDNFVLGSTASVGVLGTRDYLEVLDERIDAAAETQHPVLAHYTTTAYRMQTLPYVHLVRS